MLYLKEFPIEKDISGLEVQIRKIKQELEKSKYWINSQEHEHNELIYNLLKEGNWHIENGFQIEKLLDNCFNIN